MPFIYFIVQNDCVVIADINCQLTDHYTDNGPKLQEIRNKWLCCMTYLHISGVTDTAFASIIQRYILSRQN